MRVGELFVYDGEVRVMEYVDGRVIPRHLELSKFETLVIKDLFDENKT